MSPRSAERPVVPAVDFSSYYGRPIVKRPVWKSPDIPGYLFLGGMAGASSVLAAGSHATGRTVLSRRAKIGAVVAIASGAVGLVHDLGRPGRALNMLRVFKPTSPMSVGSWLLAIYGAASGAAALSSVCAAAPATGAVATVAAAVLGTGVASYTGALLADTAVPAWHDGHRELPWMFVGSAAQAASGLALLVAPISESAPPARLAVAGFLTELTAASLMERREGMVAEPYRTGRAGRYRRASRVLGAAGVFGLVASRRRSPVASAASGVLFMAASACTRWGVFHAGIASADDPRFTVVPQRTALTSSPPPARS